MASSSSAPSSAAKQLSPTPTKVRRLGDIDGYAFSDEENTLFEEFQVGEDQRRIFHAIKTGKNLFLSDLITDEEIIGNIGVIGVKSIGNRDDVEKYKQSVVEQLKRFNEAERRYKWHSGKGTHEAMKVLVGQWTVRMMVLVPGMETLDGESSIVFTKEWYEHLPLRDDLPEGFWEFRANTVLIQLLLNQLLSFLHFEE